KRLQSSALVARSRAAHAKRRRGRRQKTQAVARSGEAHDQGQHRRAQVFARASGGIRGHRRQMAAHGSRHRARRLRELSALLQRGRQPRRSGAARSDPVRARSRPGQERDSVVAGRQPRLAAASAKGIEPPLNMPSNDHGKIAAPLAGIRVLDFTHVLAGPFCTRLLADLGADGVRVESGKHPDHPWPSTFVTAHGRHASYLNTTRSKRSIAIDLKNPDGRRLAARRAAAADVVIENFSAGVMDRLNLGFETLIGENPRLIYVSMSGYGHDGPRRDWTSMNMNLQGYSGLMTVSGAEGDPPTAISNSWNDYVGGLHAGFAILQALDERRASARGRRIDLSQFECSASMIGALLLSSAVDGSVPPRRGNRSGRAAPQGVYPCAGSDQ